MRYIGRLWDGLRWEVILVLKWEMMRMCEMSNQGGRQVIRSCERKRRGITDSTLTDKICPYVQLGNRSQENQQQNDHYQYHWNITKIHTVFTLILIFEPDPKIQFKILYFFIDSGPHFWSDSYYLDLWSILYNMTGVDISSF